MFIRNENIQIQNAEGYGFNLDEMHNQMNDAENMHVGPLIFRQISR
jgi:hypothetical protein